MYRWYKNRHKLLKITLIEIIVVASLIAILGYLSSNNSLPIFCQEGYIQFRNECIPDEYENNFFDIMKSKAHVAFNMKLEKLEITPDQFSIQSGFKTEEEKEFFMAEVIASDNNRYFLTTIFYQDDPIEQINVDVSKIISDECTRENILKGYGCNPRYLEPINKINE